MKIKLFLISMLSLIISVATSQNASSNLPVDSLNKYTTNAGKLFIPVVTYVDILNRVSPVPVSTVISGSITPSGGAYNSATYTLVSSSGINTITAGASLISICNTGNNNANVNGAILRAGSCITFPSGGNAKTHPQVTYDALTSEVEVLIER